MTDPIRDALVELRDRIKDHPAYADLTEAEEIDIGGDTAELSYLARVADAALSAQPPERVPLTDEQIDILLIGWPTHMSDHIVKLIRAVERAHGIAPEPKP